MHSYLCLAASLHVLKARVYQCIHTFTLGNYRKILHQNDDHKSLESKHSMERTKNSLIINQDSHITSQVWYSAEGTKLASSWVT